jgi:hypothetical protein
LCQCHQCPCNYVTRRQQLQNPKSIDGCLIKVIFSGKKIMSRNNTRIFMFYICTTVLYEYMNSFRNDVYDLLVNKHVRIKIYQEFYHGIIYITNEGRHVRILNIKLYIYIKFHAIWIGEPELVVVQGRQRFLIINLVIDY